MKPNPLPFVLVEWNDAWKASTEDATAENAGDSHKPVECVTAGWVLRETEEGIQLGAEYSPDGTHRNRAFIPKAMIVHIHRGADALRLLRAPVKTRTRRGRKNTEVQTLPEVPAPTE
jgi:hypothetical protein